MTVFVFGSKTIGKLPDSVSIRLSELCRSGASFLIGDCYGIDLAVQKFLAEIGYGDVTVYTACEKCRNNIGNWPVVQVMPSANLNFAAHRKKDMAMVAACDCAIAIWDGKTKGTDLNIHDLNKLGKPFVLVLR